MKGVVPVNSFDYWRIFEKTGSVKDYLLYKNSLEKQRQMRQQYGEELESADCNQWNHTERNEYR